MSKKVSVYDVPQKADRLSVLSDIRNKVPVYIIEPFHAFHHKKGILFFPPSLPGYIRQLVLNGQIDMLSAKKLKSTDIYML